MEKLFVVTILCTIAFCSPEQIDLGSRAARPATYEEFPYVISLQYSRAANAATGHICGGGLLTFGHALTAATCLYSDVDSPTGSYVLRLASDYIVFAGAASLTNVGADRSRGVQRFVPHPDYIGPPSNVNDIGVIVLSQPFSNPTGSSGPIRPIALSNARPTDKTQCTMAGWVAPQMGQNVSNQLVSYDKYIFNQDDCRTTYAILSTSPNVLSTMVCATSLNVRVQHCQGSGGNLLVCNGALTGTLSWYQCFETSHPEIYTRTANYTTWIRQLTGDAATSTPGIAMLMLAMVINIIRFY